MDRVVNSQLEKMIEDSKKDFADSPNYNNKGHVEIQLGTKKNK